jgi:hypothetical protein
MKKIYIVLFSILISTSSYAGYHTTEQYMHLLEDEAVMNHP